MPVATVQVTNPVIAPITEEIASDAILAPLSQAAVVPRISAPILREYVKRGQHVQQGQLLITLDDRDLRGAAEETQGAVTTARAALDTAVHAAIPEEEKKAEEDTLQAETALAIATRTSDERKRLFEQGALSGRDADTAAAAAVQAQAAYDIAKKHLEDVLSTIRVTSRETAEGQLVSAQGKMLSAGAQVTFAQLRSPLSGVVTDRPLFPGETAQPGSAIITVMDTSSLLAKLHLAEASAQKLHLGDKAEVTVPGMEDPVEGQISFLSPALDAGSTTVEVWIKIANAGGTLKVGTPVHTTLSAARVEHAMQVPVSAIVPGGDGSTAVIVVDAAGTTQKKPVVVGIRTPTSAQIVSGLQGTETVVVEGGYGLEDGSRVQVGKPGLEMKAGGGN